MWCVWFNCASIDRQLLISLCHHVYMYIHVTTILLTHTISFPGGMMDEDDLDIVATAVRECREEIGAAHVDVLGLWHDVTNKDRNVAVTPVVAWLGEVDVSTFTPSATEVCIFVCVCVCVCVVWSVCVCV